MEKELVLELLSPARRSVRHAIRLLAAARIVSHLDPRAQLEETHAVAMVNALMPMGMRVGLLLSACKNVGYSLVPIVPAIAVPEETALQPVMPFVAVPVRASLTATQTMEEEINVLTRVIREILALTLAAHARIQLTVLLIALRAISRLVMKQKMCLAAYQLERNI